MTQELDAERRKLHFRSCHRGIKEMDIIFGEFADTVLAVKMCLMMCARHCSTVC